jgi:hypothetical protein
VEPPEVVKKKGCGLWRWFFFLLGSTLHLLLFRQSKRHPWVVRKLTVPTGDRKIAMPISITNIFSLA